MSLEISYIRFVALFGSFLTVSLTTFRALNTKFNEQNTNSGSVLNILKLKQSSTSFVGWGWIYKHVSKRSDEWKLFSFWIVIPIENKTILTIK